MPLTTNDQLHFHTLSGPEGTPFEGGIFPATLKFPKDYPLSPPTMKFTCDFFHPNVYADGTVCISILHAPGDDPNMYESSSERWSPVQSVEKILLSVVSMLAGKQKLGLLLRTASVTKLNLYSINVFRAQ